MIFKRGLDFLKSVVKSCFIYLSCLSPRNNRLMIFGAWFGNKFADNSKAIYLYYLKNNPDIRCVWITKSDSVYKELSGNGYPVLKCNSFKGIITQLHAGVVFYCTGSADFNEMLIGNAVHINLWHGVGGGKKIGYDAGWYESFSTKIQVQCKSIAYKRTYYVYTSCEMKKVFVSAFHVDEGHFLLAGQPRNDMFYENEYTYKTINPKIFGGKRVILYMPTHRQEGASIIDCSKLFDFEAINEFCQKCDCVFVIKKHFYHRNEVEDVSNYNNIIDLSARIDIDSNELLMLSSCLITDYSSISTDYLLLNKPLFYYCYDLDDYILDDREMYWSYNDITPGPKCRIYFELQSELSKYLVLNHDEYEKDRIRVRDMFYDPKIQKEASSIISSFVYRYTKISRN